MLLAVDVGNTHTVLGVYQGERLARHWRLLTDTHRTADEYGVLLRGLFAAAGIETSQVQGVIAASVVPPMNEVIDELCRAFFGQPPLAVGPGIRTGMPILYDNPKEVGADRIVNAVARTTARTARASWSTSGPPPRSTTSPRRASTRAA